MKYLNFDYNYRLILKMYAGQVTILGDDYFSLLYEMLKGGDKKALEENYGFI